MIYSDYDYDDYIFQDLRLKNYVYAKIRKFKHLYFICKYFIGVI